MRWRSVTLAAALVPAAAGCNLAYYATRNIVNEPHVVCSLVGIEHELRKQAKATWREVREQYPRRSFTAEFRDGFLDGYVDYLDRGGNGSSVAVPPPRYTRNKKYYTVEGQCLLKHYLLGFQYGQEVAIATGQRPLLTVPVLLPEEPQGPPPFRVDPHGTATPPLMLTPTEPPGTAPAPQARTPAAPPTPRPLPPSTAAPPPKFDLPGDPNRLPVPNPPLATAATPAGLEVVVPAVPAAPAIKLPPPPPEVPTLPDYIPTPSVLDELPVVPPNHTMPPPVLPNHPDPTGK